MLNMDNTKRLFIDTEFNGFGGELISLAIVDLYGGGFYEVLPRPKPTVKWVRENVLPILNKEPIDPSLFAVKLQQYLMDVSYFGALELIITADWPDDIKYFCESLITGPGIAIETPKMIFDLDRRLSSMKSEIPHNAYHDAIAIMHDYYEHYGV
jgi:hypothetical protein